MGFCGADAEPMIESEAASQESNDPISESFDADEVDKHLPPTPSTCSLFSPDLPSAEESNLDVDSVKSEEELECADSFTPLAEAPVHNLTSLIQALMDLKAEDHENTIAPQPIDCPPEISSLPGDCASDALTIVCSNDSPPVAPTMECSVYQSQKHDLHSCSLDATTKVSKKQKSKAKKGNTNEAGKGVNAGYNMSQAAAVHYWQAYQWQAAQYQMAYARHYQMATHAAQMRQSFQR
jgi:hypothetical protein